MTEHRLKDLREALEDSTQMVGRLVPTLFLTCLSVVIISGVDDHVLLSGGEVSTPFVGKTRYWMFLYIAPASIIMLRLYVELHLHHMRWISREMRRLSAGTTQPDQGNPLKLSPSNSGVLMLAGLIAVHFAPPAAIAIFGYHASAIYPFHALVLYLLAWGLGLLSAWSLFPPRLPSEGRDGNSHERRSLPRVAFALSMPLLICAIGGALLHNSLLAGGGVFGASKYCTHRFEGMLAPMATPFLRQINLEKHDFSKQSLQRKNLTCGDLTDSSWTEADLRESLLWGADLRGAEFMAANISQANFDSAILRQAKLHGVIAFESQFFRADLERAEFAKAELQETRFVSAMLEEADFEDATLGHAKLYKAQLSDARFKAAEITDTEFVEAVLYDAEFLGARLSNVDFYRAKLEGASFLGAELEDISFDEAEIMCTDFRSASFRNVDFRAVTPEYLQSVRFDPEALAAAPPDAENPHILWPDGFELGDAGKLLGTDASPCWEG